MRRHEYDHLVKRVSKEVMIPVLIVGGLGMAIMTILSFVFHTDTGVTIMGWITVAGILISFQIKTTQSLREIARTYPDFPNYYIKLRNDGIRKALGILGAILVFFIGIFASRDDN